MDVHLNFRVAVDENKGVVIDGHPPNLEFFYLVVGLAGPPLCCVFHEIAGLGGLRTF